MNEFTQRNKICFARDTNIISVINMLHEKQIKESENEGH